MDIYEKIVRLLVASGNVSEEKVEQARKLAESLVWDGEVRPTLRAPARSNMSKSDAQATVEFAIRSGLSKRANLTGITVDESQIIIDDIMSELFSPELIWALRECANEVGLK